jgi:glycosyltransferase involved in cell wall biosynthesis
MTSILQTNLTDWHNNLLVGYSKPSFDRLTATKIVFVIEGTGISGGLNIIIHHAKALLDQGADVTLAFRALSQGQRDFLKNWSSDIADIRLSEVAELAGEEFDLAIATFWSTLYLLSTLKSERQVYFVQSLETRFFLNHSKINKSQEQELRKCAASYLAGVPVITVATWLSNFLLSNTASKVWTVRNGIDKRLFQLALEKRNDLDGRRRLSVLLEGNPTSPMKGIPESLEVLKRPEFKNIDFLLASPVPVQANLYSMANLRILEGTPMSQMPLVYGQSDVLVKMSRVEGMFGPPLEAFHSGGTAVVSAVTGFDEYCQTGVNSIVVPVDDFAQMGDAIRLVDEDRDLLASLQAGAHFTASSWPDVRKSGREFASACLAVLSAPAPQQDPIRKLLEVENDFELWEKSLSAEDLRAFELLVSLGKR